MDFECLFFELLMLELGTDDKLVFGINFTTFARVFLRRSRMLLGLRMVFVSPRELHEGRKIRRPICPGVLLPSH